MTDKDQEPLENDELDQRITDSLLRQFSVDPVPKSHLDLVRRRTNDGGGTAELRTEQQVTRWRAALIATAATLLIAASGYLLLQSFSGGGRDGPAFAQSSLPELYRVEVAQGFTPYYDCSDTARFRATFLHRQSVPLRLEELPVAQSMLGLSYPGGISRDTTAILFLFEEQPVVVYVDRAEISFDHSKGGQEGLTVFKQVKGQLVFYEVTPFNEPHFLSYLTVE